MNTDQLSDTNKSHGGCCCAGIRTASPNADNVSKPSSSNFLQRLQVQDATCGGCVNSIEQILKNISGVSEVSMDLATGIATVYGEADTDHLLAALKRAGFPASVIS